MRPTASFSIALLALLTALAVPADGQGGRGRGAATRTNGGPDGLRTLHFRALGPGVDAGINWTPVFDDKDVSAVGALAVAPSAHETVWAMTGEPWLIRPYDTLGDGVYKSTDPGRTWQHMGLSETAGARRPERVVVARSQICCALTSNYLSP